MRKLNMEKVSDHITRWLSDYIISSKMKGFVMGVSGGIDSSVVSTLCAKTGFPLIVLEMPIHQNLEQVRIAKNHINFLKENYSNVTSIEIDLTTTFDQLKSVLQLKGDSKELSLANTRSRLRMTTLYAIANNESHLVCGTGNKVEDFGVFFYSKGGDGVVDISPIGDLMKTEVYDLGRELNLIDEVLSAIPTDGLWEGSPSDEDIIGATYPELEWAMEFITENWFWGQGMENIGILDYDFNTNRSIIGNIDMNLSAREKEVLRIYMSWNEKGKHKSLPIPVCNMSDILM